MTVLTVHEPQIPRESRLGVLLRASEAVKSAQNNSRPGLRDLGWLDTSEEALSSQQSAGAKSGATGKTAVPLVHDQKQLGSVLKIMGQRLA